MSLQGSGELNNDRTFEVTEKMPDLLAPSCTNVNNSVSATNFCCNIWFVMTGNDYQSKISAKNGNFDLIIPLFQKYRFYDGSIPLRILGRVILFCNEWQERAIVSRYKKQHNCNHPTNYCPCATKALSHILRPYQTFCVLHL